MARNIWVSTTAWQLDGGPSVEANREKACRLLDQAAPDRPDIVCLPEMFTSRGVPHRRAEEVAESVPGPTTERIGRKAREIGAAVICPVFEKRDGAVYNTAVVLDRSGNIAGAYDKIHPVTSSSDFTEFEGGIRPGEGPKVFDLDFGRIGILICFDIQWPADWSRTAALKPDILFWPSAYGGGFPLQARAWDHHIYVVSSVLTMHARIIDLTGRILEETGVGSGVVGRSLDLDRHYFHSDFNASQVAAMKQSYGRDVIVERLPEEGGIVVGTSRPDLSVADLMVAFDLEPVPDYVARHETAETFTRAGNPSPAQPRRNTRSQWG